MESKKREWTYKEMDILRREYDFLTASQLAAKLHRSESAVINKIHRMKLAGKKTGVVWTPQMLKLLKDFFPTMFNKPLAKWIGVSQRTMIRKARELGLQKREGFLDIRRKDINRLAGEALRARGDVEGVWFKKGVRSNPDGEFKKGHKETGETKAKRSQSLKESWKLRKKQSIKYY